MTPTRLPAQFSLFFRIARQRHGAGRLDDDLNPLPDEAHRVDDLLFRRREDVGDMARHEVLGQVLQ